MQLGYQSERQNRFELNPLDQSRESFDCQFFVDKSPSTAMIVLLSRFIPRIFARRPIQIPVSFRIIVIRLESRRFSTYTRVYLAVRVFPISMFKQKRYSRLVVQIDAACYFRRIPGENKYRRFVVRYFSTRFISTLRFARHVELIVENVMKYRTQDSTKNI